MRINNNMSAVITNNQLLSTEGSIANIMEKLSSGLSINHASDNPSGIAIAGKMKAQIDGLNQGSTNAKDGISVLQTAEGALSEVTEMIQRMRELSVQAANGTNSASERESIQMEIDSLLEEIDRISSTTQFNSINLLDGSLERRTYAEHCSRIQTSNDVPAGLYTLEIQESAEKAILTQKNKGTSVNYEGRGYTIIEKINKTTTGYEKRAGSIPTAVTGNTFEQYINAQSITITPCTYALDGAGNVDTTAVPIEGTPNTTGGLAFAGTITVKGQSVTLAEGTSGADVKAKLTELAEKANLTLEEKNGFVQFKDKTLGDDGYVAIKFTSEEFANALGFAYDDGVIKAEENITFTETSGNETTTYYGTTPLVDTKDNKLSYTEFIDKQTYYSVIKTTDDEGHSEYTTTPVDNGLCMGGTITINGHVITIEQGSTGEAVYEKLREGAELANVDISLSDDMLTFSSKDFGITAAIDFEFSSVAFAKALGFGESTLSKDADGNPVASKNVVGADAVVDLVKKNETVVDENGKKIESQFGNQATSSYEGNKITISDVNGFEISFLAEADYEGYLTLDVTNIGSMILQVGANEGQQMEVRIKSAATEEMYIDDVDVVKEKGPEKALEKFDYALSYVTSLRAQLGAYENRLEHTAKSLDETEENMTSAISRIEDADMATTMVEYTKFNVLAQAGTSALAQANELPQLALQLLQ